MIVLISGGAKSGKSHYAQDVALWLAGGGTHYYIATMIPSDEEDRERIRNHLADRAGMGFETVEQGRNLLGCLERVDAKGTFLLDSTTALMLNALYPDPTTWKLDEAGGRKCAEDVLQFAKSVGNIVIVSDYIYSDAARYDAETEVYRSCLASCDRAVAKIADVVMEMTAGNKIFYKGELPL